MDNNNKVSLDFEELNNENSEVVPGIHYSMEEFADEDNNSFTSLHSELKIIENLDGENFEASFGPKKKSNVTVIDMTKLTFKSLELCEEFYRMYAKLKGSRVRRNVLCKSRTNRHPTSRMFKCSAEGMRRKKFLQNPDKKKKTKELTRFSYYAVIRSKWIKNVDH